MVHILQRYKGGDCDILSNKEKRMVGVGFPRNNFNRIRGADDLKIYQVVMYIKQHVGLYDMLITSLKTIAEESGYSANTHNNEFFDPFKKALLYLIEEEYITADMDISTVRNTYFRIQLTTKKNLFYTDKPFVFLSFYEYEKILAANTRVSKSSLLGVYLYIKQFIDSESDTKVSYPTKYKIEKALKISNTTVESCISVLAQIGLITVSTGFYVKNKKNNTFIPTRNVFFIGKVEIDVSMCKEILKSIYSSTVYAKEELEDKQISYLRKLK